MELDPALFERESTERLEAELIEKATMVIDTDDLLALANLFQMLSGYASHLSSGMAAAGFDSVEAETQGWRTAWVKLRELLDSETSFTHDLATTMERGLSSLHDTTNVTDAGEPLDPLTRTFYQTFIGRLEHPGIHPTAAWLYEG